MISIRVSVKTKPSILKFISIMSVSDVDKECNIPVPMGKNPSGEPIRNIYVYENLFDSDIFYSY